MANFAGFDQGMNVSLESNFFPKIEKSQTVEAWTVYSGSENGIIFFFCLTKR